MANPDILALIDAGLERLKAELGALRELHDSDAIRWRVELDAALNRGEAAEAEVERLKARQGQSWVKLHGELIAAELELESRRAAQIAAVKVELNAEAREKGLREALQQIQFAADIGQAARIAREALDKSSVKAGGIRTGIGGQ